MGGHLKLTESPPCLSSSQSNSPSSRPIGFLQSKGAMQAYMESIRWRWANKTCLCSNCRLDAEATATVWVYETLP